MLGEEQTVGGSKAKLVTTLKPALTGIPRESAARVFSSQVEDVHLGAWPKVKSLCACIDWENGNANLIYQYCSEMTPFRRLSRAIDENKISLGIPEHLQAFKICIAGMPGAPSFEAASTFLMGRRVPRPVLRETVDCDYAAHLLLVVVDPSAPDEIMGCGSAALRIDHQGGVYRAVSRLGHIRVVPQWRGRDLAKLIAGSLGGLLGNQVGTLQRDLPADAPYTLEQTLIWEYEDFELFRSIHFAFTFSYTENAPNPELLLDDEDDYSSEWLLDTIQSSIDDNLPDQLPPYPAVLVVARDDFFEDDALDDGGDDALGLYDYFSGLPDDDLGPGNPGAGVSGTLTFPPSQIFKVESSATAKLFGQEVVATTYWSNSTAIDVPRNALYPEAITDIFQNDGDLIAQVRWCLLITTDEELALDILDESSDTDRCFGNAIFTEDGYRKDAVTAWGSELQHPEGFGLVEHVFVSPTRRGGALAPLLQWFMRHVAPPGFPMSIVDRTWHHEADQVQFDPERLQNCFSRLRFKRLSLPATVQWRPEFFAISSGFVDHELSPNHAGPAQARANLRSV